MPTKVVSCNFAGREVAVENTWFHGAKLLVDGEIVATNNDWFALDKKTPMMTAHVDFRQQLNAKIEVFMLALIKVKIQIKINDKKIAGDDFWM